MLRKTAFVLAGWLLVAAPQLFAVQESYCIAEHPELEEQFYGQGILLVPVHQALADCQDAAQQKDLDKEECKITSCEPIFPYD